MELWGNIQDVKVLAIMEELVIIQKLSLDLLLVVNLVVCIQIFTHTIVLPYGVDNYFRWQQIQKYMAQHYTR